MGETQRFALIVLVASGAGVFAVMANRITQRVNVPAPLLVLVTAAVAAQVVPVLHTPSHLAVERIVTVALIAVLFDGGQHIGVDRLRAAAAPIAVLGILGTVLTALGAAAVLHVGFGIGWYLALLVGTAVAPTDPAVVFSVLGQREIAGRSSTVLEGESGANDPVGIALLASLLSAGHLSAGALGDVAVQFALQMGVGLAVGVVGGWALLWFTRAVALPGETLYPLRALACAGAVFGVAALAHGSGFLAVFVAGIVIGDQDAPYKGQIERFSAAMAGLGEVVAFTVLGLSVELSTLTHRDVWLPGLVLAVLLGLVIRPVLVGPCLWPARLQRNEQAFVLFAGLKGAVPILLGVLILAAAVPQAQRLFGIVVIVVIFSVAAQGSGVPAAIRILKLPLQESTPPA